MTSARAEAERDVVCDSPTCWCRTWPPVRWIPSTDQHYSVEELPSEGTVRVFRYAYLEAK